MMRAAQSVLRNKSSVPRRWLSSSSELPQLQCYLDTKSPHAYLALGPTLQVAYDYKVQLEFLPYQL